MNSFSANQRQYILTKMASSTYDLIVVGGGITGAGIALDASSRGLKVALLEKKDFAHGTSSRSTKLVHGGLRYLKQFEIGLVREVGTERAIVHRNARHLVVAERMLLPIVEKGSLGKMLSSIGLWVYDKLANVNEDEKRKMLSKDETAQAEPLLRTDILRGGGLYYEYRTDDARLTIEVMKTAVDFEADCVNHAEVTDFLYEDEKIVGVKVFDNIGKKNYTIRSQKVVNAAGPWVDELRQKDGSAKGKRLHLTKGVHLVLPFERLPLQQSVYFDVPSDGRMVFAIPRGKTTYIGTTDTTYTESIETPYASSDDVRYLLDAANYMFPSVGLRERDIISSWAGLRPLIYEEGKTASEISRKDEIFVSQTGLISIAGGKLTGYRKMAERVVDLLAKQFKEAGTHLDLKHCWTQDIRLTGGDFDDNNALEDYIEEAHKRHKLLNIKTENIKDLVYKYGTNADLILTRAANISIEEEEDPEIRLHYAELWYGVEHEMCVTLSDYLVRRTGRLYFERPQLRGLYPKLAQNMAQLLHWNNYRLKNEVTAFEHEYREAIHFEGEVFV